MGKQLTLQLVDMAYGGEAVGRAEGKAVFVPLGIPGESVRVEVVQDKGRFARARLLEVLSPSPQRVQPPCPYFGACGGCQLQHVAYGAQIEYKRSIVQAQLQRIAALPDPPVRPTLGMAEPWHYRNHAQFSVSDDAQLGYMTAGSHHVIPIERCLLLHPLVEELFDAMDIELPGMQRLSLRAGIRTGEQMIIFEMEDDLPPEIEVNLAVSCALLISDGTVATLLGSPHIHERLADRIYRLSATSFFQVNTEQAEVLVRQVVDYLNPGQDDIVLDAYCGVGTFALSLAGLARQVVGVESESAAIEDAWANASGLANLTFHAGLTEEVLPILGLVSPLVVLDPPRTGLEKAALQAVMALHAPRIVYVSCDPTTLARDVKVLLTAGYSLHEVQPVDMFPQTYHIESVALLERV